LALAETARVAGLDRGLARAFSPWRKPTAFHDPGKIVLDLAVALALGGTCLADIALLREQPGVFGPVASDPTVSHPAGGYPAFPDRLDCVAFGPQPAECLPAER